MDENINRIKERYLKESFNKKVGHLASDLARISSFIENSSNKRAILGILAESRFFIEWAAPEATLEIQAFFCEMQTKIALWHYQLLQRKKGLSDLIQLKEIKAWSSRLIEISGLSVAR